MRVILGCVVAVLVAALGGLIMGEYELRGVMALLAGVLFGLAVAEAAITVGKSSDWLLAGVAAVAAFAGLTWAASIDAGDSLGRIAGMRWAGSVLAMFSAGWWVRTLGSRSLNSPPVEESA
ncbi:MAG: hypothetical protein QOK28_3928 [Actinomycetota bacterium]